MSANNCCQYNIIRISTAHSRIMLPIFCSCSYLTSLSLQDNKSLISRKHAFTYNNDNDIVALVSSTITGTFTNVFPPRYGYQRYVVLTLKLRKIKVPQAAPSDCYFFSRLMPLKARIYKKISYLLLGIIGKISFGVKLCNGIHEV